MRLSVLPLAIGLCLGAWTGNAAAESSSASSAVCQDAEVLSGRLITDIPWNEIFPIWIAGGKWGSGRMPSGAAKNALCLCNDKEGIAEPGVGLGLWTPARLVELVRQPGCMPTLSGTVVDINSRLYGTAGKTGRLGHDDMMFYHYHEYAFPLFQMLNLFWDASCAADGYVEIDVLMLSEIDPTWVDDELAFFQAPESTIVANKIAQAACSVDALAAYVEPLDDMFWCVGSWGSVYPLAGHETAEGSLAENTSLLMARGIATMHRRGLAWRTIGDDAQCRAKVDVMLPKRQYKASMFFPLAEANDTHTFGEYSAIWGDHRKIPATGEDAVYVVFRWQDCCLR